MRFIIFLTFICFFQIQCIESGSKMNNSNLAKQVNLKKTSKKDGTIKIDIEVKDKRVAREGWDETGAAALISQGKIDLYNLPLSSAIEKLLYIQKLNCHAKNGRLNNKAVWRDDKWYVYIQGEYDATSIERYDVAAYIYSELQKRQLFQMDTLLEELSIIEIIDLDPSIINNYETPEDGRIYNSNCSGGQPANEGGRLPPVWRSGKWKIHFKDNASIDEMIEDVLSHCFGMEFKIQESVRKNPMLHKKIAFDFDVSDTFDEIKNGFLRYGINIKQSKEEKEVYILDLK